MTGSEFVSAYAKKGLPAWEAAMLALARQGALCPWPLYELVLKNAAGDQAVLTIDTDALAVGTLEDHVRMPLLPGTAQSILNLTGRLLPTPWIVYQQFRAAALKLEPVSYWPNKGADLVQYAAHSAAVDAQKGNNRLYASGTGKNIVVSNVYLNESGKPRLIQGHTTVLIQGMYRPPPSPEVFDDHKKLEAPDRQPIQPLSYAHADFYVDYSHVVQGVWPVAVVNGREMLTEDLYRHPTLSSLVSNEGPLRFLRYPSQVPVMQVVPAATAGLDFVRRSPGALDRGLAFAEAQRRWRA